VSYRDDVYFDYYKDSDGPEHLHDPASVDSESTSISFRDPNTDGVLRKNFFPVSAKECTPEQLTQLDGLLASEAKEAIGTKYSDQFQADIDTYKNSNWSGSAPNDQKYLDILKPCNKIKEEPVASTVAAELTKLKNTQPPQLPPESQRLIQGAGAQ
jgi:hypothetical protein